MNMLLTALLLILPAAGVVIHSPKKASLGGTVSPILLRNRSLGNVSAVLKKDFSAKYHTTSEVTHTGHAFGGTYTLWEPVGGVADASLIILGPWNSTTGFMKPWFIKQFQDSQPNAFQRFRILDVVGKRAPTDSANPYGYSTWYEYEDWHNEIPITADVDHAVSFVHSLLAQECSYVYCNRVVLAGFSQGGNIAIESAIRYSSALALVFSERGVLLGTRSQDPPTLAGTPYILTGGAEDHVYDEALLKESCKWLQDRHVAAYLKFFPGLDHYAWSTEENELAVRACAAIHSSQDVSSLDAWADCRS